MSRFFPHRIWMALPLLAACEVAKVDMVLGDEIDSDEDGLMDADEVGAGTDPSLADSDDDGHNDGAEVEQGTDPLDVDDHPYKGGWKIDGACRDMEPESTGNEVGDIAANFELTDQYGDTVRLYDFCNRAIVLISGAFW